MLAVDTTTTRGSLALVEAGEVRGEVRLASPASHSRRVLPAVRFLLDSLGLGAADVDGYAVTVGPGSFTGTRIGIATVQGLALPHDRPCLGISALEVLAARLRGSAGLLVAWMDAWRDEVYAAVYDADARLLQGPRAQAPAASLAALPGGSAAFLGDGASRYRELIETLRPDACLPERSLFLAGSLGKLAAPRLAAGEGGSGAGLRPLYVRPADIGKARA